MKCDDIWIPITSEQFEQLKKLAIKGHSIKFCTPEIYFYWDEEGAKYSDLSFGQHAFLKEIKESDGPEPYVWPSEYYVIKNYNYQLT